MTVRNLYLRASASSLTGKIVTVISSLAVIWLINHIGGKDTFGHVMVVYSLNYILATSIATQFQTVMMYHVSRDHDGTDSMIHADKIGAGLFMGLSVSCAVAILEFLLAPDLASLMHTDGSAMWFRSMAWMIPCFTANSILTTWYRARQDVSTMVMYFEILPSVIKVAGLIALIVLALPANLIGAVYNLSYLVPFAVLYLKNPIKLYIKWNILSRWDMTYGAQNLFTQMMSKSVRNIVIFLIGFFAAPGVVADYTLAMRLGQFLQIPKLILTQIQVPRMGEQIKNAKTAELMKEFEAVRALGLASTVFGTAVFILIAPYFFRFFGDYQDAYAIFLILAVASIIMTGFGSVGGYVSIAGYAGSGLLVNFLSLLILVGCIVTLVPIYGGQGAAVATVIGSFSLMLLLAAAISWRDGINTLTLSSFIDMGGASVVIFLAAYDFISGPFAAVVLTVFAALTLLRALPSLKFIAHVKGIGAHGH